MIEWIYIGYSIYVQMDLIYMYVIYIFSLKSY